MGFRDCAETDDAAVELFQNFPAGEKIRSFVSAHIYEIARALPDLFLGTFGSFDLAGGVHNAAGAATAADQVMHRDDIPDLRLGLYLGIPSDADLNRLPALFSAAHLIELQTYDRLTFTC